MPRKAAPLLIAAFALAILATLGWIKWNARTSDAWLRADLENQIRRDAENRFAECDLSGLTVRNLVIDRSKTPCAVTAELVIPRRKFATHGIGAGAKHHFEPNGTLVLHLAGNGQLARERLAILPFLGEIHPVWAWSHVPFRPRYLLGVQWNHLLAGGPNALFDAHFHYRMSSRDSHRAWRNLGFLAIPELRRTGRLNEAAALWAADPGDEYWDVKDPGNAPYIQEATVLLRALEAAGPGHEKSIAQMRALLK